EDRGLPTAYGATTMDLDGDDIAISARHSHFVIDEIGLAREPPGDVLGHDAGIIGNYQIQGTHLVDDLIDRVAIYVGEFHVHVLEDALLNEVDAQAGIVGQAPELLLRFAERLLSFP